MLAHTDDDDGACPSWQGRLRALVARASPRFAGLQRRVEPAPGRLAARGAQGSLAFAPRVERAARLRARLALPAVPAVERCGAWPVIRYGPVAGAPRVAPH